MTKQNKILIILLLTIAIIFIAGCVPQPKPQPPAPKFTLGPGDYDFQIQHQDLTRKYLVHVPTSYDKNSETPLVIAMHGGGGSAKDSPNFFRLNPKSDKEGFILVYPEGSGKEFAGTYFGSWNAGRCCNPAKENNVDDIGFIKKMIEKLKADFNIDENRIYVTGFSNGAQMTYRLACEMSDKIAAIAPGGSMGSYDACNPKRAIPIFAFDGTADTCSLFEGGNECGVCFTDFLNSLGIPVKRSPFVCEGDISYIAKWRKFNNCTDNSKTTYQNGNATCITYDECDDNAEITFCIVEGMGHTLPGPEAESSNYGTASCKLNPDGNACTKWKETLGPVSSDLNANEMIWDFFKKHPLK